MMILSDRQKNILEIIKENNLISGDKIALNLGVTRSALRTDFKILKELGMIDSKPNLGYSYLKEKANLSDVSKEIVKNHMSPTRIIETSSSVYDTILFIFSNDVGTVCVVEDDFLVGIVSRKDLLKIAVGNSDLTKVPISLAMTRVSNIIYCEEKDSILECVEKLIKHGIDSLPVVRIKNNKNLEVVGRITKTNITKLFLETIK